MNLVFAKPHRSNIELLFAVEREVVVEPDEVRHRATQRARAALPRNSRVRLVIHSPGSRRVRIGRVAGAAVMLSTLCAVAFHAGYQARSKSLEEPVRVAAAGTSVAAPPVSGVRAATAPSASPQNATLARHPAKTKPAAVTEREAYAMELQVLQPAQQAVVRQDFPSVLAAVAEHGRRFPSGRLAEEREALRVKALLGLGRAVEAQRTGFAFRKRFPRSALLGRMDEMLGTQK